MNTIEAEQLLPAIRLEMHVFFEMLKSAALVPEIATFENVTEADVALVTSTDCAAVLEPTAVDANVRLEGFAERLLAATPRPESVTV